jgi:hypothetical protein
MVKAMKPTMDQLLNDFAIRCFRDTADGDYIAARLASRCRLAQQFLWSSQQAVEKYLKCILLLNRIEARNVKHNLSKALDAILHSNKLTLELTESTSGFIGSLNNFGEYRYLEVSNFAWGHDLVALDRSVWDLRRYCTLDQDLAKNKLTEGVLPPRVSISCGFLEKVMEDKKHPARSALLWQNAYFGGSRRRFVHLANWFSGTNAPLYLNPQILPEVKRYVHLPEKVVRAYELEARKSVP